MNLLQSLQQFRLFRFEFSDAGTIYQEAVARIDRLNNSMGICYFDPTVSRLRPRFVWGLISLAIYMYLAIESTYWYRHDIEKVLMCITTHGLSIQMASKIYTFIINRDQVIDINEMNKKYFEMETVKSVSVQKHLKSSATIANILLEMTIVSYNILVGLIILIPVLYGVIISERVLPLGLEVSHSFEWPAFAVNLTFQANCAFYVAFLTASSDTTFILYLLTAIGQIDAISGLLEELNCISQLDYSQERVTVQLRKIFELHQHHVLYTRKIKDMFCYYFFMAIASLYFVMAICLAALVLIDWYMGIVLFSFCSAQIFYMCILGTALESKTEKLVKQIGSFSWHRLSPSNQKLAVLFLTAAQNPILISAATVKLNVATYLQIHKSVYSALMLLLRIKE